MSEQDAAQENLGIKETQEVAALVVSVVKGIQAARADGKWDASDLMHLMPVFGTLGPALENFNQVGKEIGDLDANEIKTIAAQLLTGIVLEEGKIKVYVEEGLNVVVSIFKIIKAK